MPPDAAAGFSLVLREAALEASETGILVADLSLPDAPLVYVNAAAERLTGYGRAEMLGRNCRFLQGGARGQAEVANIRAAVEGRQPCSVTLRNFRKDGSTFWNQLRLLPILDEGGQARHYFATLRDVTAHRDAVDRLERLTTTDAQTGLLNRAGLVARMQALLDGFGTRELAVAKLDLVSLRDVNNSFGAEVGDGVLIEAARRLTQCSACVLAGRLDGGRFAVALPAGDETEAAMAVETLVRELAMPFAVMGTTLSLRTSAGYTLLRGRRDAGPPDLMREASIAANDARHAGPGEIRAFDRNSAEALRHRLRLTAELVQALEENAFELHYQPKVELGTGRIVGAEALLRWHHPIFGLQGPGRFIGAAESSGLISGIGDWALRAAARFAAAVNAGRAADDRFPVWVNVSSSQFQRCDVPRLVREALADAGAEADWIGLELTESLLADGSQRTLADLSALSALGIGLAVDDFGTGYSSLRYLRDLPFSEVKVDRSFVAGLDARPRNTAIVAAVLRLAGDLGLDVTCEGVETAAERDALAQLGCPVVQGYFFCRPLPGEDFARLVERHRTLPVPADAPRR